MKEKIRRLIPLGAVLVAALFVSTYVLELDADARAGGGRSSGSRGSRSSYSPAKPAPSQPMTSPQRSMTPAPAPMAPKPAPQTGGFMRSLGMGLAGGFLGSMLFSSLGHGGGFGGSGGGGGIGLMDIIILGALLYFVYWFFKRRKAANNAEPAGTYYQSTEAQPMQPASYAPAEPEPDYDKARGVGYIRQMDPSFDENRFADLAMDIFFKVQGGWGNRDLGGVRSLLTEEMYGILQSDAEKMKQERKINKLENIAVRSVEITEAWQENGKDFITVRFIANLLDYTVSDSGELLAGSKTDPVKFEEYWTFVRPVGNNPWQLSGIDQAG